jgi:nucleoid-associated protein YgaU
MVRTRVRWRRVTALAIGAVLLTGIAGRAAASAGSPARREAAKIYVVQRGDTLWGIAVRLAGPTSDPRPLVDAIASLNRSDGTVVPGQTLQIPRST